MSRSRLNSYSYTPSFRLKLLLLLLDLAIPMIQCTLIQIENTVMRLSELLRLMSQHSLV